MPQRAGPGPVKLRTAQLREHARRIGIETDSALAAHLGISGATVSRMLSGSTSPGVDSIAATLAAFPDLGFDDLFEVVDHNDTGGAA